MTRNRRGEACIVLIARNTAFKARATGQGPRDGRNVIHRLPTLNTAAVAG